MAAADRLRARPAGASCYREQYRLAAILRNRFGPSLCCGCRPVPPAAFRRREGRDGRGLIDEDEDDERN